MQIKQLHKSGYGKSRTGLSLIELTITLLLIGLVAAVATPKITQALDYYRIEAASEQIVADIKNAQHHAKTAGTNQKVTYFPETNSYQMPGMKDKDHPGIDYEFTLGDQYIGVSLLEVDFNSSTSLTFNMYGQPESGGVIKVTAGGQLRTITVGETLGRVTVQ